MNLIKESKFWRDSKGSMAINFALTLTTILIGVGVAVDYSAITSEKATLQDLVDSTALSAAISNQSTHAELQSWAEKFVEESADFSSNIDGEDIGVNVVMKDSSFVVELTKEQNLFMLDSFGHGSRQIFADAEVPLFNANRDPSKNFNIALALDLTNTMNGFGRLDALKDATNNFFTALETRSSDDTMVSLVPYSNYVRLNVADNINQPWIEIPDEIVEPIKSGISGNLGTNFRTENWEGCMNSRIGGAHATPDFGGLRLQGFYEGDTCSQERNNELVPLTSDWSSLNASVQNYTARGDTYIPAGLIWAWRTLSPNAPFTEAAQNPDGQNILILMTDGDNRLSLSGEREHSDGVYHYGTSTVAASREAANQLTLELCEGIKDSGTRIFTITFRRTLQVTKDLLAACAFEPGDAFNAETNENLEDVFEQITERLLQQKVRLMR